MLANSWVTIVIFVGQANLLHYNYLQSDSLDGLKWELRTKAILIDARDFERESRLSARQFFFSWMMVDSGRSIGTMTIAECISANLRT